MLVLGLLVAGAIQAAPAASRTAADDTCPLLAHHEIEATQGAGVKEVKRSQDSSRGLRFAQCTYATMDFARSVNLTLISGDARRYWAETFQRSQGTSTTNPPRPITGVGDEAFWTGDQRAGALYLLSGDVVLRISVGGVADEEERIRRSTTLASAAVRRLKSKP